jgi:hypothetical protein
MAAILKLLKGNGENEIIEHTHSEFRENLSMCSEVTRKVDRRTDVNEFVVHYEARKASSKMN